MHVSLNLEASRSHSLPSATMAPKKKNRGGRSGSKNAAPRQPTTSLAQVDAMPPDASPTSPLSPVSSTSSCSLADSSPPSTAVSQPTRGGGVFGSLPHGTSPTHRDPLGRGHNGERLPAPPPRSPSSRRRRGRRRHEEEEDEFVLYMSNWHMLQLMMGLNNASAHLSEAANTMEELESGTGDRAARLVLTPLVDHARWVAKTFNTMEMNLLNSFFGPRPPSSPSELPPDPSGIAWIHPPEKPTSTLPDASPLISQPSSPALQVLELRPSSPPSESSEAPSSSGRCNTCSEEPRRFLRCGPMKEETACQLLAAINLAVCELSLVQVGTLEVAAKMRNKPMKDWLQLLAKNARELLGMCMKAEQLVLKGCGGEDGI